MKVRLGILGTCLVALLAEPSAAEPVVVPTRIELIPPGTQIDRQVPKPWTHLIIKSQPRVTSGDIDQISQSQLRLAGLFFMATLAEVGRRDVGGTPTYRLAHIASGIGTRISGRDTIVSPSTVDRLGANVGFLAKLVLREMYAEQQSVNIICRSQTCAVYDTPIVVQFGGKNKAMVLRYGVFVDAGTGRLDTLVWLIGVNDRGVYTGLLSDVEWLAPNLVLDCKLHVDKSEYILGVPRKTAFASIEIPQGRNELVVSDADFALQLSKPLWTRDEAQRVASRLREAMKRRSQRSNSARSFK